VKISVYLKESKDPTRKPTKAKIEAAQHALALSRVRRPDFEAAVFAGKIHALPRISSVIVKDVGRRRRDHRGKGDRYVLTVADMGRAKTNPDTIRMAFLQWVIRYFVKESGIFSPDEIAVVVDTDEE
jgi:hypothetical protein